MPDTRNVDTDKLYEHGRDSDTIALTMIRCLDYDHSLLLDDAAYRAAVRTILDAAERANLRRLDDLRVTAELAKADLDSLRH